MFTFSKLFWIVFQPGSFFVLLMLAGAILLFTRWQRTGRVFVILGVAAFVVAGLFPVGSLLIGALENRFPGNPPLPPAVGGIVVLGGTVNPALTEARGQPSLTDGAERLTEFIRLAHRYPDAKLVFSGGSGSLTQPHLKETVVAAALFDSLGFDDSRVEYENRSRNTYENAIYSRSFVAPDSDLPWILVTSAAHMPRAVGSFRRAGWRNIVPWPVDYQTDGTVDLNFGFDPAGGMKKFAQGLREWIGLAAYRILGRTDAFFPEPAGVADN